MENSNTFNEEIGYRALFNLNIILQKINESKEEMISDEDIEYLSQRGYFVFYVPNLTFSATFMLLGKLIDKEHFISIYNGNIETSNLKIWNHETHLNLVCGSIKIIQEKLDNDYNSYLSILGEAEIICSIEKFKIELIKLSLQKLYLQQLKEGFNLLYMIK